MDVGRRLMLIDGQWVESIEGQFISVENPSRRGTKEAFRVDKIRNPNIEIRNKFEFSKFKFLKLLSVSNI